MTVEARDPIAVPPPYPPPHAGEGREGDARSGPRRRIGAFGGAQFCRARTWIFGDFRCVRYHRAAREHTKGCGLQCPFGEVTRTATGPAARRQAGFDDPVFQRMERNHHQATAGFQNALGRCKTSIKLLKFLVDEQPQRLKRPRCGMDIARPAMNDATDNVGERAGRDDRPLLSRRHDGVRDRAGMPLLAQVENDVGEIALRGARNDGGGGRPVAAHAHVERPIVAERETPLRRIELHGRDAEIEDDAVRRHDPKTGCDLVKRGEPTFDQGQASAGGLDQGSAVRNRLRIAIDADHARIGGIEDRRRIAAGSKRAVDIDAAGTGGQMPDRLARQHRHVPCWRDGCRLLRISARVHFSASVLPPGATSVNGPTMKSCPVLRPCQRPFSQLPMLQRHPGVRRTGTECSPSRGK